MQKNENRSSDPSPGRMLAKNILNGLSQNFGMFTIIYSKISDFKLGVILASTTYQHRVFEASWGVLGALCRPLGASWARLGASWAHLGAPKTVYRGACSSPTDLRKPKQADENRKTTPWVDRRPQRITGPRWTRI